ncbi:hypothetical protein [[Eubacterium] cellulosolvens]
MAKSTEVNPNPGRTQTSSKMKNGILLIPLLALLAIVWLMLVKLDMMPTSLTFGWDFDSWVNFWMVVLVILIVVLICIPQTGEHPKPEEAVIISKPESTKKVKRQLKVKPATVESIDTNEEPMEFVPITKEKTSASRVSLDDVKMSVSSPEVETSAKSISDSKTKVKPAEVVAPSASKDKIKPKVLVYPSEVEGGIYGDTFIKIDDDTVMKLRTLVVEDIYLL